MVKLAAPVFPQPSFFMAVTVSKKGAEGKISSALARLMEEDPTLSYENNAETHQQIIGGLGEQHLDVVKAKMKNKFGVEIGLEAPRIAYRESIRKPVQKQGRHKKQTGGHGQFGDVVIKFEPCEGEGIEFAENVFGGSVPKNFFPAVKRASAWPPKRASWPATRWWGGGGGGGGPQGHPAGRQATTRWTAPKWPSSWPPNWPTRPPCPRQAL